MSTGLQPLHINIGGLQSLASIYNHLSGDLQKFNNLWSSGETPEIIWDFREIKPGCINLAAISFFLAIAHRVRQYTESPPKCLLDWNSRVFGFLADIDFFYIANQFNLLEWPYEIGGYETGKTNPNTKLLVYTPLKPKPSYKDKEAISKYKQIHREEYSTDIIAKCEALFTENDRLNSRYELPLIMSRLCAELATNSILWGESPAFLGLQRTSKKITICISDIGVGFKNSLAIQDCTSRFITPETSDIFAIAIGCVKNTQELGLRRAISELTDLGGTISITSSSGEIFWKKAAWLKFIENFSFDGLQNSFGSLPNPVYRTTHEDFEKGYTRHWTNSIRGSRINFSIPLKEK